MNKQKQIFINKQINTKNKNKLPPQHYYVLQLILYIYFSFLVQILFFVTSVCVLYSELICLHFLTPLVVNFQAPNLFFDKKYIYKRNLQNCIKN